MKHQTKRLSNPCLPESVAKALIYHCMVCQKSCEGWYSQHEGGGTCSKTCMIEQDKKPKYGEHTEEAFLKKFKLE